MKVRKLRIVLLLLAAAALAPLLHFGLLQASGNFHTVAAGKLYRSAQPSARDLTAYARTFAIKSVINLRGRHPGEAWYDEEVRASAELGLQHLDIPLSAHKELSPAQLLELEDALRAAPGPVLVHCKSGADRTGLAAALYLLDIERAPASVAAGQLSWRYGHWPYFGSRSSAMDRTFERAAGQGAGH